MSFPTFLMSFAASHSGCQASTKIGATPAHTGKVHTQVVSCLCFVSTERTRQASCCTSGPRELNFALTWIAFVFGSKTWLENGNCRTVSLCAEHISWVLAHSCPKNATVTRFRCGAEHIPLVSARWKLGSLRQLSSFPLGYPKTVSVSGLYRNDLCS